MSGYLVQSGKHVTMLAGRVERCSDIVLQTGGSCTDYCSSKAGIATSIDDDDAPSSVGRREGSSHVQHPSHFHPETHQKQAGKS